MMEVISTVSVEVVVGYGILVLVAESDSFEDIVEAKLISDLALTIDAGGYYIILGNILLLYLFI